MKMKITGYALKEAIKQQELIKDTAAKAFPSSLKAFEDDKKDPPGQLMETFIAAETAICRLQTAQMRFNLAVQVVVQGETMSLAQAIKLSGLTARVEAMWRTAVGTKEEDRYFNTDVRETNQIRSKATISQKEALGFASKAAKRSSAFREAIAKGNATEVELAGGGIEDLDESLFG
jgi:hypothetical protein